MIRAIIIDDEKTGRDLLKVLLERHCPQISVIAVASSVDTGCTAIEQHKPDLVFMDIELGDGTAFDLLNTVKISEFAIIFVTAYNQYTLKAFKYSAIDYLLKPVDETELIEAVSRMQKKQASQDMKQQVERLMEHYKPAIASQGKIGISSMEGYEFVEIADILRCEADGKYTTCYIVDGRKMISSRNIKEFEDQLLQHHFFRVHNSHLVNIRLIKKYHKGRGGYVVMNDDVSIPVAERKKDDFLNSLQKI